MRKLFYLYLCSILLLSCQKGIPFDPIIWNRKGDVNDDNNERYDMAIWMINNNWFQDKTKDDIISNFNRNKPCLITKNQKTYLIKQTEGWNIDRTLIPLAYIDIYFKNNLVVKVVLRERKQSWLDKLDGFGNVSEKGYKIILVWNAEK